MELKDEWFRPAACYLVLEKKMDRQDVAKLFGVSRQRVSRAVDRFEETGEHKNREGQGRKRTARDEDHIEQVNELLDLNNHTKRHNGESGNSVRKLAKKLEISKSSAHEILKDDLGLTAWKKTTGQKLTDKQKKNRLERAKALKERFANGLHRQILFTDEKFFPIEEAFNHQNDRIWSAERPGEEERVVQRQMKSKGVMVWMGVGYNAKAPLIFVKSGLKIDTDLYRRDILRPVKRWAIERYGVDEQGYWNDWCFQQDSAPSHASFKDNPERFKIPTQKWLDENFPDFITKDEWPAASPDLNVLDYCIWSIIEAEVNAEAHSSVESLKKAIENAFENLDQNVINRAVDNWMKRLDKVIAANGGHFE